MSTPEQDPARYLYALGDHPSMRDAYLAGARSQDPAQPVGVVLVDSDGGILGMGANGSDHHERHGCERRRLGCRSGEGYDLCEGCSPKNHAEVKAIADARSRGNTLSLRGATAYMWGHWWACASCWAALREVGIDRVVLLDGARSHFEKRPA